MDWNKISDNLWRGTHSIACFIHDSEIFWIISNKDNFILDGEKELRAYIKKGHIKHSDFKAYSAAFRGGISHLTSDSFNDFLRLEDVNVVDAKELKKFFFDDSLGDFSLMQKELENHLYFGREFSNEILNMRRILASRLPTFYINFVRSIYSHMDWGRFHENLAHQGWYAKCEDFGHNISVGDRYWWNNTADFWSVKHFSD